MDLTLLFLTQRLFPLFYNYIKSWHGYEKLEEEWKVIRHLLEDLFLGGQSSIILGYRRFSVEISSSLEPSGQDP